MNPRTWWSGSSTIWTLRANSWETRSSSTPSGRSWWRTQRSTSLCLWQWALSCSAATSSPSGASSSPSTYLWAPGLNAELKSFNYSSQIWPWLLVHFIYLIFLVSLLVYLLIILTNVWLQVILFLVLAPVIIILLTSWLLLLSCSNSLQQGDKARSLAGLAPPSVPTQLMTLYAPQTPIWLAPSATGPGRSRRARSESVCLSEKFANSESAGGKNKAISNVHTSSLEIEIADRTKQNVGSLRGKPGRERRRMRSGCSSLSEKYSPKLSRSYNNDPKQDLIVELPNIMPPASK